MVGSRTATALAVALAACSFDASGVGESVSVGSVGTGEDSGTGATTTTTSPGDSGSGTEGGCEGPACPCDQAHPCVEGLVCDGGSCVAPACGDGLLDAGEVCDDGNPVPQDGCEADCTASTGARTIVAGTEHTCALTWDGRVRCWGDGASGRTGHGDMVDIGDDEPASAAAYVDVGDDFVPVELDLGASSTCTRTDDGRVRCFGNGEMGRLGYGNVEHVGDDEAPATAGDVAVGGVATAIAVGSQHACVLLGTDVRCWGSGGDGRLGYGDTDNVGDDEVPASRPFVPIGGAVADIVAGAAHSCALLVDGAVRCWGSGDNGRLGYVSTNKIGDDETPASAGNVDLGGAATMLVAGAQHNCVVLASGRLRCWGAAQHGALGTGALQDVGDDETPAIGGAVEVGGTVVWIDAGRAHTCVLLDTGVVRCWGEATDGQLGLGDTNDVGDDETPASSSPIEIARVAVLEVSAGGFHTCSRLANGALRCWGAGMVGQLGYGDTATIGDDELPITAGDVPFYP